ncbi:hypothetical protein D9M71_676600 [compost metagenome]
MRQFQEKDVLRHRNPVVSENKYLHGLLKAHAKSLSTHVLVLRHRVHLIQPLFASIVRFQMQYENHMKNIELQSVPHVKHVKDLQQKLLKHVVRFYFLNQSDHHRGHIFCHLDPLLWH